MNYAAFAFGMSAIFAIGFIVGVLTEKWFNSEPKTVVATLDELRTELRSIQDEPWTDQQLIDWKETVGEAFRDAIAKQNCDPENPDADTTQTRDEFREMVYAMVQDELRRENLIGFSSFDRTLVGLSKRVENLEGADVSGFLNLNEFPHHRFRTALEYWQHLESRIEKLEQASSEFHGRLSKIEGFLGADVAAIVAPSVDSPEKFLTMTEILKMRELGDWTQQVARKASDAVQEKTATATLPDDEEVVAGVTRRELNESKAAAKLLGQLLRDARLQSNGVSLLIAPETIEEYESGGLLPSPGPLDKLIAAYQPSPDLEKQILDAWRIAQKPYLGRVSKANQES